MFPWPLLLISAYADNSFSFWWGLEWKDGLAAIPIIILCNNRVSVSVLPMGRLPYWNGPFDVHKWEKA